MAFFLLRAVENNSQASTHERKLQRLFSYLAFLPAVQQVV